jgi:PKD repeat protein
MKNIALLLVAIPLFLVSCTKDPFADFTVSDNTVGVGETVYFTNRSIDAESFEWDFGDGFVSNSFNASHYYDIDGVYNVSLKANYKGRGDIAFMTVSVIGASLEITVEEYYTPFYLVPDISVILYGSVSDWEHPETSPIVAEGYTNASGVVIFDHLAAQRYYVDIWGPNHDNYKLAEEDVGFIETPVLIPGTITTWTALVDYYPPAKKSLLSRFETKAQRKIEAEGQVPRNVEDRVK